MDSPGADILLNSRLHDPRILKAAKVVHLMEEVDRVECLVR